MAAVNPSQRVALRELTLTNRFDVVATISFSALLIIAASCCIRFATHPFGSCLQLKADFSLNLPMLIATSSTFGALIFLTIQIARHKEVKRAFSKWVTNQIITSPYLQQKVRDFIYWGKSDVPIPEVSQHAIEVPTKDGVVLRGYWHFWSLKQPTIIFFHGNGGLSSEIRPRCRNVYAQYNVLFVEFRGYGSSDGVAATENAEEEAYLDAEAAVEFVKQAVPDSKIIAHGFSLGGAYAAAAGMLPGVEGIILDHSFSNLGSVISTVTSFVTEEDAQAIVEACFSKNQRTDSFFNNVEKIRNLSIKVLIIQGKDDEMMPPKEGDRLLEANPKAQLVTRPDEHVFWPNKILGEIVTTFVGSL